MFKNIAFYGVSGSSASWRCHKASVFTWFGAPRAGPGHKNLHLKIASAQMAKHGNIAPKMAQHGARRDVVAPWPAAELTSVKPS